MTTSRIVQIAPNTSGKERRVAIVLSRFNEPVGRKLLAGAVRALGAAGVAEQAVLVVTGPGALETPLALQRLAQTRRFDALVALGAVIRGETYHFEIVANESAAGVSSVGLESGVAIGNGILTTDTDAQALARAEQKGAEATLAALEMANLQDAIAAYEK
jgi:6,7-dimethyl-8-ribityllumazine synthase